MPNDEKRSPTVTITNSRARSSTADSSDMKSPRTARSAKAAAVISPIESAFQPVQPSTDVPMDDHIPQPQPADTRFGYPSHEPAEMKGTDQEALPPPTPKTLLKNALNSPGAASRGPDAWKSPTSQEEQFLEEAEKHTEEEQKRDLKAKMRVRAAKFFLRGVNFSCSLVVLSMLSATFAIFNATKSLPPRNNFPSWAQNTKIWPQVTLLVIACISLLTSIVIFYGYCRGGHRGAEKFSVYYTSFALLSFIFSIIMWGVGAALLNQSRVNGNGQDIWGWSCEDNRRRALFQSDVAYALVCHLQNWSLACCIIEVVVEVFTILVYGIIFYRYYSKRRLHKSMAVRDRARSDLAQRHAQPGPNTPDFGLLSTGNSGWHPPPGHPLYKEDEDVGAQEGVFAEPRPFTLHPPPTTVHEASTKVSQNVYSPIATTSTAVPLQTRGPPAAEKLYEAVAIPRAY